jgi:hypothetical protein
MGSTLSLRSRNTVTGDAQSEYDAATSETVTRYTTIVLDEDFVGPSHAAAGGIPTAATVGYPWIQKTVKTGGSPSVAAISNASGGVIRCSIDATSEKQEATLYAADVLNWDMTKSAVIEFRLSNHVLPSAAAVEMAFGLHSAWIDGPDNASFYADFQQLANGTVNFRTKDGVQTLANAVTSWVAANGTTYTGMVVDQFHIFRIDATDPTNVRFFIDGAEVSSKGQMSFAATGANAILQPYFTVYKASGTGVGTFDLDMVQCGMNRS